MEKLPRESKSTLGRLMDKPGQLEITVGPRFADGIKSPEDEQNLTPEDIHTKIRFLTNMANQYLESGSSEKAFHSLMKAYLLDPLSPYVVAAEKTVLPAWESLRTQQKNTINLDRTDLAETVLNSTSNMETQIMEQSTFDGFDSHPAPLSNRSLPSSADEQLRMEMLRQQKEQERLEKERAMWREASKPPRIFGEDDPINLPTPVRTEQEQPRPQSTGLFSKLRLGKFLE